MIQHSFVLANSRPNHFQNSIFNIHKTISRTNRPQHEEHEAAVESQAERNGNDGGAAADNRVSGIRGVFTAIRRRARTTVASAALGLRVLCIRLKSAIRRSIPKIKGNARKWRTALFPANFIYFRVLLRSRNVFAKQQSEFSLSIEPKSKFTKIPIFHNFVFSS